MAILNFSIPKKISYQFKQKHIDRETKIRFHGDMNISPVVALSTEAIISSAGSVDYGTFQAHQIREKLSLEVLK